MRMPDCRTDESYNQKDLKTEEKIFISGFDDAVEQAINILDNMEFDSKVENKVYQMFADTLIEYFETCMESYRNESIVSMLEAAEFGQEKKDES